MNEASKSATKNEVKIIKAIVEKCKIYLERLYIGYVRLEYTL